MNITDDRLAPIQTTPRILIVEDNPDLLAAMAGFIGAAGYATHVARDGEAGWAALSAETFDLLITDYEMPRLSGVELLERMHAAGITLPVIMTSGVPLVEAVNPSARAAGWLSAFLPKPFGRGQLLATVRNILRTRNESPARV